MRQRYIDLQTGLTLSLKELLESEKQKDVVWEAADEMRSLLENLAETREELVQELLHEAYLIRDHLNKYAAAEEMVDGREGEHRLPKRKRISYVPPNEGKPLWFVSELYTPKAGDEDTSGAFTLVEAMTPPGAGSLPHIQHREAKTFYVLEGQLQFMVADDTLQEVGAGSWLFVQKGTLHSYKNVGTRPAKYLVVHTPAGIERFFEEVSIPALDRSSPPPFEEEDLNRVLSIAPKYGLEIRSSSETHN